MSFSVIVSAIKRTEAEEPQKNTVQILQEKSKGDDKPLMIFDREKEQFVQVSEDFRKARERIAHFKAENGKAPNDEDYYNIIFNGGQQIHGRERPALWLDICKAQQSPITKEDLTKIYLAKRESIKDFYVDFTVERFQASENGNEQLVDVKKWKYAIKNNSMFFSEIEARDSKGNVEHRLSALNQSDFRYVNFFDSSADAGIQRIKGTELGTDGLCLDMPLVSSMIFDLSTYNLDWKDNDLPMMFARDLPSMAIMEKTEEYEGNECLVIKDLTWKFFLNINKDFSVCGKEFLNIDDLRAKDIQSIHPRARHILYNLVSYGNGIWLPTKVERIYYDADQNVTSREHIVYNEIRINEGIKDSFFEDVIPDGALVSDSIRDMVYVWGNRASIGSLIKETVKPKRQTIYRNLSVVLGLCLIVCWGIIEWRKRRLLKGEVE